ncbi:MAG TPA: TIM-barrel domain-containing protein [Gemmatimonadaceae bacterium]|nr:TIM-barrel domain-containing protein [Gemmatimonadaceae bacterium]
MTDSRERPAAPVTRRAAIERLGVAAGAGAVFAGRIWSEADPIVVAGRACEISVWSLSAHTVRVVVAPLAAAGPAQVANTGALAATDAWRRVAQGRESAGVARVRAGDLVVRYTAGPPTLHVETAGGAPVQTLTLDAVDPGLTFEIGNGPLLGFGEGGAQFDRRGVVDQMRNGQVSNNVYRLATHGTRAPVQWLIGAADGWAMFVHQPYGAFDLTGSRGKLVPAPARGGPESGTVGAASPPQTALAADTPLDVFVVASREPGVIMREYARITGLAEMPARWTFGYQQSHRTLDGPDEILGVARKFREKKLPCDALIYLGTEFTPSGWNTRNGEFTWKASNFPRPKEMLDELHREHFRVVLHVVIEGRTLTGSVSDTCTAPEVPSGRTPDDKWPPDRQAACYWPYHKPAVEEESVDGWWPDQGDGLDGPSRLNRHRMYWEGMQLWKPNERPFALHRNASPGIQRYGGFIWSGDTQGTWRTLELHVPNAINSGLSGFPYWGSDIGGFYPTPEYTGELQVRWFQFASFCPSFRSHGRHWHLRVPWGWDDSDGGPMETNWRVDPAELHNKSIEPILRKYLELRYRLMPYLYSAVRECHETGMPIMRAMWLHHPDDPTAVARGDQFFFGQDVLVAPVVEKGATSRRVYLPRGVWYDFWTEERIEGGKEITRPVDLSTVPMYVRAGATIPVGPVKEWTEQPSADPVELRVYPGANASRLLYDDDGHTFDYRKGEWMGLEMTWNDAARTLALGLARGSKMPGGAPRSFVVRVAGSQATHPVEFRGRALTVTT